MFHVLFVSTVLIFPFVSVWCSVCGRSFQIRIHNFLSLCLCLYLSLSIYHIEMLFISMKYFMHENSFPFFFFVVFLSSSLNILSKKHITERISLPLV